MTHFGFTGTQKGMMQRQRQTVRYLLHELLVHTLHFGDCTGADAEVFRDATDMGLWTVSHPPTDEKKRAFCKADEIRPPFPYMIRNGHIVQEAMDGLIAAPSSTFETIRSGTWSTVRRARRARRKIWIVYPDGTFKPEEPHG